MLARRYLNPRRSMLSSFSLISLIGVILGVLALVVVMAVYSGLERNVKKRLLGSTPHVLMRSLTSEYPDGRMDQETTAAAIAKAKELPHVRAATAFVADSVVIDSSQTLDQPHVAFRGIDTSDPTQVQGVQDMLDLEKYPESSADLGIEDRAVISSLVAERLQIGIGDKINLVSTKNAKEILRINQIASEPPVREQYAAAWKSATEGLAAAWKADGDTFVLTEAQYGAAYEPLFQIWDSEIRETEKELIAQLLGSMDAAPKEDAIFRFDAETKAAVEKAISDLNSTDRDEMDLATFRGLQSLILPKEVTVAGVYQASQMTVMPDLFVPLPLAQDLAGLGDAVQGISLRLDDPYFAEIFAENARHTLGENWSLLTWGEQYQTFFSLIEQQRAMMYFVLVFIMLVSAFSIMAVMFTITIQKRREIGVMKALGAAPGQIVRVFLYQGMILGILGGLLGVLLGRVVIHFREQLQIGLRALGFDPFASSFVGFNVLPAHNNPVEQVAFALGAFILCSLAALVPAFFAARSDAAKSLRNL